MYERRRLTPFGIMLLTFLISLFAIGDALAFLNKALPQDKIGGSIHAVMNGKAFYFPTMKSDITASIEGDLATVTIKQTFLNPTDLPLKASYLFPLNKDAAVHFMQMEIGDERIIAVMKTKQEARATYERAKNAGKSAALLNQHRPNMFTQELTNLMPGQPVKIVLKYSMAVPRIDGAYELVLPLVVGPRYTPQKAPAPSIVKDEQGYEPAPEKALIKSGQWSFSKPPAYPEVSGLTIPDSVEKDRVSIHLDLRAAFPIKNVKSTTHQLLIEGDEQKKIVTLAEGRTIDNRDFVLRYELAGRSIEAGLLAHHDKRGHFFSLMVEPPNAPDVKDITPREMVFVLDTSGSMSGLPMEASKTFMRHAIKSLRPDDYFRIIRFSNNTGEFSSRPVQATLLNKIAGIKYVNSLTAGGGTQIPAAIERAFAVKQQPDTLRLVTFLSDGYIGNEARVLQLINRDIGNARIYAFGVGTSVNRYLLAEMARAGRGMARFIDPAEDVNEVAVELAARLEAPLLIDIEVDWGELGVTGQRPRQLPDLFKGGSVRLMARSMDELVPGSTHTITIKGKSNGRKASMPVTFIVPQKQTGDSTSALPLIWARTTIADHMRSLTMPLQRRGRGNSNAKLEGLVTKLGLDFSLMTQWTSFVAVSEKIVNETPKNTVDTSVPLNQVKGVSKLAYPKKTDPAIAPSPEEGRLPHMQKAQLIRQPAHMPTFGRNNLVGSSQNFGFGGSSTPEPGALGGMALLVLMMLSASLWRKRREA